MRLKILFVFLLLCGPLKAGAQTLCLFTFPSLSTCSESDCSILINMRPRGVARVLPDNNYGSELGINFGEKSVLQLGDNGRLGFGNSGGIESVLTGPSKIPVCRSVPAGLFPYVVDMTNGGWLDFSGNNRLEFVGESFFVLGSGSKIDGRLDIQSDGTVGIIASGELVMPNVDLSAPQGITLSGQGNMQIGNLENRSAAGSSSSTSSSSSGNPGSSSGNPGSSGNQGIIISAEGDVTIGVVDGTGNFSVTTGGDISVEQIRNAESISLTISPPDSGIIKIGGRQTTDNPVMCAPPDDCNGFQLDGGGSSGDSDTCEPVNADGSASDCAGGGGAAGPLFILLCLFGRRGRGCIHYRKNAGVTSRAGSPLLERSV